MILGSLCGVWFRFPRSNNCSREIPALARSCWLLTTTPRIWDRTRESSRSLAGRQSRENTVTVAGIAVIVGTLATRQSFNDLSTSLAKPWQTPSQSPPWLVTRNLPISFHHRITTRNVYSSRTKTSFLGHGFSNRHSYFDLTINFIQISIGTFDIYIARDVSDTVVLSD